MRLCRPFSDLFAECLYLNLNLYLYFTEQPGCSSARPPTFFSSFCSPASASYVASNAFLTCWHVCNLHTWIVRYMHTWIPPGTTQKKIYIKIYKHLEPISVNIYSDICTPGTTFRKYIFSTDICTPGTTLMKIYIQTHLEPHSVNIYS